MRSDMVSGAVFPDYELPDHTAKRRKLSELQGQHPMVLALSRGGYCPKDRRQHEGLVQLHREIEVGYCRLVTISTDNITETNEYRSGAGAHWPFLSDAGRKIQKDSGIRSIPRSCDWRSALFGPHQGREFIAPPAEIFGNRQYQ